MGWELCGAVERDACEGTVSCIRGCAQLQGQAAARFTVFKLLRTCGAEGELTVLAKPALARQLLPEGEHHLEGCSGSPSGRFP